MGWSLARWVYRIGGKGGVFTSLYNLTRARRRPTKLELFFLDSGLRREFAGYKGVILVDHPLLGHLLAPVCKVAYLHGEIAAPPGSGVPAAWLTFVPLEQTARRLEALGVERSALCVTGLVIEPELIPVAERSFPMRLKRYQSNEPLTVAFFTSGAYPPPHLRAIVTAARSVRDAGHNVLIFTGIDQKKAKAIKSQLPADSKVEVSASREEETAKTAELFSQIDVFVSAAHERTNWAVGLGLPMFALLPHIGPFAKENFAFAFSQGVCLPLIDAEEFGSMLNALCKKGKLTEMACAGWGKHAITGANTVAEFLSPFSF